MNVNEAFDDYQRVVDADVKAVEEARRRRDLFKGAFNTEADIDEVLPSGSLARGTHKHPIHDVDVVLIYNGDNHPEWGQAGDSAEVALDYTRSRVNSLLGATHGTYEKEVRLAKWRNHAVKCWLDDPDDPDAFTVDAMPALRRDGMLLIPEALSEKWVPCDPEYLIDEVAARHAEWNKFAGVVRMLKAWASDQQLEIKSLVMEVLALQFLPTNSNRPSALKNFFVAAAYYIEDGHEVVDPADICGPIQPKLDYSGFGDLLRNAADTATRAISAQVRNDPHQAITYWRELFGDEFPEAPDTSGSSDAGAAATAAYPRPVKDTPQG